MTRFARPARFGLLFAAATSLAACQLLFGIDEFVAASDPDASTPDSAKPDVVVPPGTDGGDAEGGVPPVTVDGGCPSGRGPSMVHVGANCIDSTEVTEGQYGAFVASANAQTLSTQPPECTWNQTFVVGEGPAVKPTFCTSGDPLYPVRCVDYCDALAFCKWAGKRLCGSITGLAGEFDGFSDPLRSEWMAACTGKGNVTYPYGNTFDEKKCNGIGLNQGKPTPAGNVPTCQGPQPGLFDMSGNVHEWESACIPGDAGGAAGDRCRIRGGSMTDGEQLLRCAASNDAVRSFMASNVGFRCCATATP